MAVPALVLVLGGVGAGKSSVLAFFAEKGITCWDADACVHALSQPGEIGWQGVVDYCGDKVLLANGHLNRAWLRDQAFAEPTVRHALEAIFHPLVNEHLYAAWQSAESSVSGYVLMSFPLIPDTQWLRYARRVLTIDASYVLRIQRLCVSRQYTQALVYRMLRAQPSRLAYLSLADDVLFNDNSVDALRAAVSTLHLYYASMFSSSQ